MIFTKHAYKNLESNPVINVAELVVKTFTSFYFFLQNLTPTVYILVTTEVKVAKKGRGQLRSQTGVLRAQISNLGAKTGFTRRGRTLCDESS